MARCKAQTVVACVDLPHHGTFLSTNVVPTVCTLVSSENCVLHCACFAHAKWTSFSVHIFSWLVEADRAEGSQDILSCRSSEGASLLQTGV
jgi:hypothetical protein